MLRPFSLLAVSFLAVVAIAACSSSTTDTGGSSGSSGDTPVATADSGADAADAADAAPVFVNDCKTFTDRSAASDTRILTWDFSIAESTTDRCIIIKKGQTVTWMGDFSVHPLASFNGDSPNPIDNVGAEGTVTFDDTGTFGWHCEVHPSMIGAVQVTE